MFSRIKELFYGSNVDENKPLLSDQKASPDDEINIYFEPKQEEKNTFLPPSNNDGAFESVPNDIMLEITPYLSPADLENLYRTNKRMRNIAEHSVVMHNVKDKDTKTEKRVPFEIICENNTEKKRSLTYGDIRNYLKNTIPVQQKIKDNHANCIYTCDNSCCDNWNLGWYAIVSCVLGTSMAAAAPIITDNPIIILSLFFGPTIPPVSLWALRFFRDSSLSKERGQLYDTLKDDAGVSKAMREIKNGLHPDVQNALRYV
ncbi:MAG: hypothetical protein A3F13_08810 [Gammaproteobacteria bacterium RIFCSPHIGHO2_12_FULL_40_19]|nr:MAG: hypothetical protein A3F13_08810 [Gammaproteobacteria bacterium RIFCSPHIGHO2_12_FULL_40_19]